MKDVQKIKEFFSNPVKESISLDDEAKVYWMQQLKKGKIDTLPEDPKVAYMKIKMKKSLKEESDLFKINTDLAFKIFDFLKTKLGEEFTSEFPIKSNFFFQLNDYLKGMNEAMTTAYEAKEESYMISKSGSKSNPHYVLEKPDGSKQIDMMFSSPEEAKKYAAKKNIKVSSKTGYNMNEAKEEDKVDTITMDVPLFIRMLEYSREDAAEDMDLHDVTEKAISLGKERGILQMDDYDEIIGSTEEIKEAVNLKQSKLSSAEYQQAKKLKDFKASDWKWNASEDLYTKVVKEGMGGQLDEPYFVEVSVRDARIAMDMFDDRYRRSNIKMYGSNVYAADTPEDIYDLYYDFQNQDIEVLDYNVDGDLDEATDYMKRRKAMDDYAVSKKDKPSKPYNPNPSGKTDYMKRRQKELAEMIFNKLKK
jgi:hypothetical protein